jgi:PAS domain S-box-containing protein
MLRKDGMRISVLASGAPRFAEGRFAGALEVFADITERKRMQDELVKLKEFNEGIIRNMYEGVGIGDAEGYWTFVNPAMGQMLGYSSEELIGRHWTETVPPDQHAIVASADERRRLGLADRYEVELIRKDGQRITVEVSGSPQFENSNFIGVLVVFTDVSARKQAEEALRRRATELAALHSASLTITASHDLDSLIHTIIDQAMLLLGASGGGLSLCDPLRRQVRVYEEIAANGETFSGIVLNYGQGAAGWVAEHGKPLIIDDYSAWPERLPRYEPDRPFTATLSVPIIWRDQVTGVLQVTDDIKTRRFNQEDTDLLRLFADQAAIAIENARLLVAERESRERAEALREATRTIGSTLSLEAVLSVVLEQLQRILPFDSGSTMLIEEERVVIKAWRGPQEIGSEKIRASTGLHTNQTCGTVARTGEPLVITNVQQDERWEKAEVGNETQSWLGIPLRVRDRVIGVFSIDRWEDVGFTAEEIALAQTFAANAATAIDNARLYEAEEQRSSELLALRQASLSLTASLELEAVLYAILESALHFLPGALNSHIYLYYAENSGRLAFGAALWSDGRRGQPIADPRPNGLTYTVAHSGETIVVKDMKSHPLYVGAPPEWQGAIVGLPLKIGQRVVGVMNISYPLPHQFSEAELRVLGLLGDQAAIAIENARLFERAATERRHLGLLYELGRELATTLNHNKILERANTLTCQALGGLVGEAFLFLPATNQLSLRALYGRQVFTPDQVDDPIGLTLGKGLAGWVAQNRTAVNVTDVQQDPRWLHIPGLDEDVHGALVAPILDNERLLGVLSVLHHQPGAFSNDHLELLIAICQQTALAMHNAESYQQVQNLVDLLAAEQYRLESLLERLPVGVLLLDDHYCLMIVNLLGREILSQLNPREPGEVLTHLGPHAMADFCSSFATPGYTGEALPVEIMLEGQPRTIIEAEARAIGGEPRQWVITLRDVTQERESQERIKLQERLATVGQLAAGIAHDFNNIMAAILIYADLLMRDTALAAESRERLGIIQQQVQRATSLIRQILDFSRRSVVEQNSMDLLPFVKELDKLLSRVMPETIRLELKYEPGSYLVNGDPTRLQQVFMNLALNARDAMPQGGTLRFELKRSRVESAARAAQASLPPGEWVCIEVADSGDGIPSEVLPHIFDPFFTTKPVGKGTGLGLAQVYGIIQQHQGQITVTSQMGVGTKFTIYLPALAEKSADEQAQAAADQLDGSGKTVLVVEDDPATLAALQALLQARKFNVLSASNGLEALAVFEQHGPTITFVVADVVMPEMGGVALHNALKERWPGMRMLFVTGHPLELRDQVLLEKGDVHWLQKPFSMQDFNKAVQDLLSKQ